MITDEEFKKAIEQISNAHEDLKDHCRNAMPLFADIMDAHRKLAKFRDIACIALRASHTTKNPGLN